MSKNQSIASLSTISMNAGWLVTYQFLNGAIQFLFFLVILRIIPQADMDIFELGRSCLEIGVGIIGSSVSAVVVRENARRPDWWFCNVGRIRNLLRTIAFLIGIVIYGLVIVSSHSLYHVVVIGVFCLSIYLQSRSDLYESFFRSRDQVALPVAIGFLSMIGVTLLTLVCVLLLPHPVLWATAGVAVRWLIQGTLLSYSSRRYARAPLINATESSSILTYHTLLKEITPISIGAIAFIIYARLDILMLEWMGFSETIAIYGCAFRLIGFLMMLASSFFYAFAPSASKMIHSDAQQALRFTLKVGFLFSIAGLLAASGIIGFRHEITRLLYPEAYSLASEGLRVLAWTLPIVFGGNAVGLYLISYGKRGAYYYMMINFVGILVNLTGNFFAIPHYQFVGAAWTTVLTDLVTTLLMLYCAIKLGASSRPHSRNAIV